jgi:hypothetical protein
MGGQQGARSLRVLKESGYQLCDKRWLLEHEHVWGVGHDTELCVGQRVEQSDGVAGRPAFVIASRSPNVVSIDANSEFSILHIAGAYEPWLGRERTAHASRTWRCHPRRRNRRHGLVGGAAMRGWDCDVSDRGQFGPCPLLAPGPTSRSEKRRDELIVSNVFIDNKTPAALARVLLERGGDLLVILGWNAAFVHEFDAADAR